MVAKWLLGCSEWLLSVVPRWLLRFCWGVLGGFLCVMASMLFLGCSAWFLGGCYVIARGF